MDQLCLQEVGQLLRSQVRRHKEGSTFYLFRRVDDLLVVKTTAILIKDPLEKVSGGNVPIRQFLPHIQRLLKCADLRRNTRWFQSIKHHDNANIPLLLQFTKNARQRILKVNIYCRVTLLQTFERVCLSSPH